MSTFDKKSFPGIEEGGWNAWVSTSRLASVKPIWEKYGKYRNYHDFCFMIRSLDYVLGCTILDFLLISDSIVKFSTSVRARLLEILNFAQLIISISPVVTTEFFLTKFQPQSFNSILSLVPSQ